jgi:hypothetical protein
VRAPPGPGPIGKTEEVFLVDGVQHLGHSSLEDLVLQGGDAERALAPVGFGDVRPAGRLRPVRPGVHPAVQVLEVGLQVLAVGSPRQPVHSRGRFRADGPVGLAQAGDIDVVQQGREPCVLVPSCYFAHTAQPCCTAQSGSVSGTCLVGRDPLGRPPSLHRLRSRGLVRQLRRYYGAV